MSKVADMYYKDVRQKNMLRRSARYKKGGSKAKGCRLPSDGMTKKEWERRNGEVVSISKYDKLTWKEYLALPTSLQAEYVQMMRDNYGARNCDLAEMFGTSRTNISKHLKEVHQDLMRGNQGTTKIADPRWVKFMEGEMDNEINMTVEEVVEHEPVRMLEPIKVCTTELTVCAGELVMVGNPEAVFTKALLMLDRTKLYSVRINFVQELDEEDDNG